MRARNPDWTDRGTSPNAMHQVRLPLIASILLATGAPVSAISIDQFNTPLTENFNTLAASGTSSTVPAGWTFSETGTSANSTYAAGTGSSNTGDTYSFGASGSTDRAFGTLLTGSLGSTLGASFTNNTSGTVTQLSISCTGEQWRLGATGRTDRLDFAFSLDGINWVDVDALDFLAPNANGSVGALDGNADENHTTISYTITGLSILNGGNFWLRWSDFNASGADDGLGIDDFSLTVGQGNPTNGGSSVPDGLPLGPVAVLFAVLLLAPLRRCAS